MHQRPPILILLLVASAALIGCQRDASSSAESARAPGKVKLAAEGEPAVELVIKYGDGVEKRFTRIPFEDAMTVSAALQHAAKHPRGITFEKSGTGEAALLTRIDDLANQAGADGNNWLYRVNGKLATKSFDAYVLAAGDVILWSFQRFE